MNKIINISYFWFEAVLYSNDPQILWGAVEYDMKKEGF